jgi:predicted extracellular nuclease
MKYLRPPSLAPRAFRLRLIVTLLILFSSATIYLLSPPRPVKSALIPSVAVNKYFNGTPDVLELLVIQDNLDMRGMIVKDFSSNMANDGGGKFTFTTDALWSSVRSGTLIVLRNNNSAADTTVGGADYNLDIGLQNTTYFTGGGGTFDIATTDMVMIKAAGSGTTGVTGNIHTLAGGTAGAQFTATASPKLIASGTSGTNQFVFANNSTQNGMDFDGTDATGAATGLTFGVGNNANNTAYINSLRNPAAVTLSINDVTQAEGNSGTTNFNFTVSLNQAAPAGGVSYTVNTADGTATLAYSDYQQISNLNDSIPEGQTSKTVTVLVNGDTATEANENFTVNITNVTGATLGDGTGIGTISNDDVNLVPIHDIQGNGSTSPFLGQSVTTTGIVTALRTGSYFIQTPDANIDADPNTSEGVLVFTSPGGLALGSLVQVTGTVAEFRSTSANINSPTSTELTSASASLLSTGNVLPTPVTLTAADTNPTGSLEQLEKYEGMRVHINSMTVVAPTDGFKNEANATSTSSGVFWGVITGVARPFREPGIEAPNGLPTGSTVTIPPVPRFDANPEHIRVDSDAQTGASPIDVTTGATITNLTGVFDPGGFPNYTLYPEAATVPSITGISTFVPVPVANPDEFTVAAFNLERFYDNIDDTGGDAVLTATAFNNRLNKASLAIRNVLRTPDILGIEEMEDLKTLTALANKINSDAVTAGDPNPMYQPYLEEGNDIGLIDVGFLVKSTRVTVIDVTQLGKTTTYINPNNGSAETLNDRPPLVLRATVANSPTPFPITVIVNHLRSLNNVDDDTPDGAGTTGSRIRAKRQAQAVFLANLIQTRQAADPTEKIISVGDYNAFQFNDGLGDSISTIKGTPTPDNQTVVPGDGADLVNPDLVDLIELASTPAGQKYSYSFDGNAQALDHELVNQPLMNFFSRFAYARVNGDFPEVYRTDANRPERISDHDAAVAYFFLQSPTAAKLTNFAAMEYGSEVLLQWQTGEEVDNLGFNLYREEAGRRTRLTPQLVAGSALVAGERLTLAAGRAYAWWDAQPTPDAQYWLEEIDLAGKRTWHGPIQVTPAKNKKALRLREKQAQLINQMGRDAAQESPTRALEPKATIENGEAASADYATLAPTADLAGRAAVKLFIKRAGLYRVAFTDLIAAGLDPTVNPRMLQLFVDGQEVPMTVSGKSAAQLDASASLEFYGLGIDSAATDERVYWLVAGNQPGKRIQTVKGGNGLAAQTSFLHTVERKDRTIYFSALRNGDKENFFGAAVTRTPVDQSMTVQHPEVSAPGQATVEVTLQGVTRGTHRVGVSLNGVTLGEVKFEGQMLGSGKFSVPQTRLKEGTNQITLVALGAEGDISLVDSTRISYWHTYFADNNALAFTVNGKEIISIGGFTNNAIKVFDVTNANEVQEIAATVSQQKGGYAVTLISPFDSPRTFLAVTTSVMKRPERMVANRPSNLRASLNAADLLIIAHSSLLIPAGELQAFRQGQGLQTLVVDVEDIFDEFSFGQKHPQALKNFFAYAQANWQKAPRFVVLMGDASYDPKNYLGRGDDDLVPTRLLDTAAMETASDEWFIESGGLNTTAKIAIGRLPARGVDEASRLVAKLIAYEQAAKSTNVLLVSDAQNGFNFEAASGQLESLIKDGSSAERIDRGQTGTPAAKLALQEALSRGQRLINYSGHGSATAWMDNLLTATEARSLTNQHRLPLFVMMDCLNGYFPDATSESLAEALLKAERGGAIAVWASSGITLPDEQTAMNQQLFKVMFDPENADLRLGELLTRARAATGNADVRRTWILFGDPSMRLK